MNIEETKFIVEATSDRETNDYLELGWILVNQYIVDAGEYGQPDQRPRYVLAWQQPEVEPPHPESSSYVRHLRAVESLKETAARFPMKTLN